MFNRGEDPDAVVARFVAARVAEGVRVAGFTQETGRPAPGVARICAVRDIETGARFPVLQDLGAGSSACRVDPHAVADMARLLGEALERGPGLLVVNRFGRLEAEGGGVAGEIGAALAAGVPVLVSVPRRYETPWAAFAAGLDARFPPSFDAIEEWWRRQVCAPA